MSEFAPLSRFDLDEPLNRGGCGVVRPAYDNVAGRVVAVKQPLGGASAERLRREGAALAAIGAHPAIIGLVARSAPDDAETFVALELVPEGRTLSDALRERLGAPFGERETMEYGAAAAAALAAVHAAGFVHRDVKLSNLLLTPGNEVKLADFGSARRFDGWDGLTAGNDFVGTAEYASPEQRRCAATAGPESDVYSLGVTLFVLRYGRLPARTGDGPFAGGARSPFETILQRCLRENPENRYASAADLLADLQAFLANPEATPPSVAGRRRRRHRPVLAAVALPAVLAVLVFVLGSADPNAGRPDPAAVADRVEASADRGKWDEVVAGTDGPATPTLLARPRAMRWLALYVLERHETLAAETAADPRHPQADFFAGLLAAADPARRDEADRRLGKYLAAGRGRWLYPDDGDFVRAVTSRSPAESVRRLETAAATQKPHPLAQQALAVAYALTGETAKAAAEAKAVRRFFPWSAAPAVADGILAVRDMRAPAPAVEEMREKRGDEAARAFAAQLKAFAKALSPLNDPKYEATPIARRPAQLADLEKAVGAFGRAFPGSGFPGPLAADSVRAVREGLSVLTKVGELCGRDPKKRPPPDVVRAQCEASLALLNALAERTREGQVGYFASAVQLDIVLVKFVAGDVPGAVAGVEDGVRRLDASRDAPTLFPRGVWRYDVLYLSAVFDVTLLKMTPDAGTSVGRLHETVLKLVKDGRTYPESRNTHVNALLAALPVPMKRHQAMAWPKAGEALRDRWRLLRREGESLLDLYAANPTPGREWWEPATLAGFKQLHAKALKDMETAAIVVD